MNRFVAISKSFTEHGALQAANILNSPHAIKMSVLILRAFVKLRGIASTNEKLSRKFFVRFGALYIFLFE